ncbi:signal peptide peptidase A. Serine peptidase. MEROPS family S49 [Neorhodopirellula lusitana]|uniref:Signal peptide peptidase A. Serine peptidase. MEROPS family S49 n=1 Tax=Neorhodopirellula lusitana TaxID=445327 RepID=A0ABY1PV37_9BACT|nr:S49 family peptidase [Neorhodopirellula lusitana]SMP47484.1 signal peptide peptidase A. Serine peptidase. MEROPS family S49 [Neorhodopirellula lusitana]
MFGIAARRKNQNFRFIGIVKVCLLVASLSGCQHPVRALVGGNMNLGGKMGVDGDIRMTGQVATVSRSDNTATPIQSVVVDGNQNSSSGRIAVVDVDGLIVNRNFSGLNTMGENPVALFREKMRRIECDGSISAVVLRINTPGGGVTATDILANDIARLKKCRDIPVVACLMTTGCGGGYYLATHADQIVAHPTSVVGGIGVILNSYNMEDTLGQYNVVSIPVKAGDKIDLGSPERAMGEDERDILQVMADQFHERFIAQVKRTRRLREPPTEDLIETDQLALQGEDSDPTELDPANSPIFDGRVWTGNQAVEIGLVDSTGYLDDAIDIAGQMAGLSSDAPVVLLRRSNDRALSEFDVTPIMPTASLLPMNVPGMDRSMMPTFLYLWQPEPKFVTAGG